MTLGTTIRQPEIQSLPSRPSVAIMGVAFDPVTMEETLTLIDGMIQARTPRYLATANLDFAVQASSDLELRRILFDAHLVLCDGMPLVWTSRLLGAPLPERVTGSDMTPLLLKRSAEKGYRVFLLGGAEDSLNQAVVKTREKYPDLAIDAYSPPFKPLLEMDHEAIIERVREFKPDLLFVAFGCPKQEKWINMHFRKGLAPVSVGVGATIDFIAGHVQRAPVWMQKTGTEWIYRLLQEPKRLFKRYMLGLGVFAWKSWCEILRNRVPSRLKRFSAGRAEIGDIPLENGTTLKLAKLPQILTGDQIRQQHDEWAELLTGQGSLVFDCTETRFLDSLGVGLLLRLRKQSIGYAGKTFLAGTRSELKVILQRAGVDLFLETYESVDAIVSELNQETPSRTVTSPEVGDGELKWSQEVTAANVDEVWEITKSFIDGFKNKDSLAPDPLKVDLTNLTFIDSSGVGLMVKSKKYAASLDLMLEFRNPSPAVENVLKLTRMKDFLIGKGQSK